MKNNLLEGKLVVSIEQAVAAPYCSVKLADAGARVIKVERKEGDFARYYDNFVKGDSTYFVWLNRGKESLIADIKNSKDQKLLKKMILKSDIFIQNLLPGTLEKYELDSKSLRKKNKIAVLCESEKSEEAKKSGAEIVGSEDLIEKISSGKFNFTKLICTPSMMAKIGKHGKVLGPKGLMPNPKLGTVTNDIAKAVKEFKTGLTEIRNDKDGNLASSIGRKSFSTEKLIENFNQFVDFVKKEKPSTIKGEFIKNIFITSTMGISYKVGAK